ncbi:MAG: TetR family transcriptional regulator C-terminal domain-containing protein [Flavobacteriales bacterium]
METKEILSAYSNYVTEHNSRPQTMAAFAKHIELDESDIYKHFANFASIEAQILRHFVDNAIELTHKNSAEDEKHNSRESLLTFYFTFTEILKANRSLVLFILPGNRAALSRLKVLKPVKTSFSHFVQHLDLNTPALSFIPENSIKDKALEAGVWMQFCSILLYWLKDDSADFEKTDIFIEKSLKLTFDLAESNVMESVFDLGKFMFGKS